MPIIKQPNGKWAVWNPTSDEFACWDCTREELIEWWAQRAARQARVETERWLNRIDGDRPWRPFITWEKCLETYHAVHGKPFDPEE
jgi:hypothetical protein